MKTSIFVQNLRAAGWKFEYAKTDGSKCDAYFQSAAGFLSLAVRTNWTGRIERLIFNESSLVLVIDFYISKGNTKHYPLDARLSYISGNDAHLLKIKKTDIFTEFKEFILDDGALSYLRLKYADN